MAQGDITLESQAQAPRVDVGGDLGGEEGALAARDRDVGPAALWKPRAEQQSVRHAVNARHELAQLVGHGDGVFPEVPEADTLDREVLLAQLAGLSVGHRQREDRLYVPANPPRGTLEQRDDCPQFTARTEQGADPRPAPPRGACDRGSTSRRGAGALLVSP